MGIDPQTTAVVFEVPSEVIASHSMSCVRSVQHPACACAGGRFTRGIRTASPACLVGFQTCQINGICGWFTKGSSNGTKGSVFLKFGLMRFGSLRVVLCQTKYYYQAESPLPLDMIL